MGGEEKRLQESSEGKQDWKKWGPYLSERQWGTVREDYSESGEAWKYFPHDHARSRAYRWGEDGLGGISDINQDLCFALALWNGKDPILKERLFGLTSLEGNHGEDVKELYYYVDNTPTHSYMKFIYKYPQREFPYKALVDTNQGRSRTEQEFELPDTGALAGDRYFDISVEYAKADPGDILIRIEIFNRSREAAGITALPTLWFRNTWSFGKVSTKPDIRLIEEDRKSGPPILEAVHEALGRYRLYCETAGPILFTENETNTERLFGTPNSSPFVKDAFHKAVVKGDYAMFEGKKSGTKGAVVYRCDIPAEGSTTINLRLADRVIGKEPFGEEFRDTFRLRILETDEFYRLFRPSAPESDVIAVQRQAFAGLLWNKQYYNYELETWLKGDPGLPPPPQARKKGRNADWIYLFNRDVISMPDKWEYPWYASWDLAFHCVPLAMIDAD